MAIARRPVRLVVSSLVTLVLLAGCASDRAYDQQRAQETARTTDQAVIDIQASFTANRYASPTTTATPTPQPPGILHEIGLATSISGDNQPSTFVTAVANNAGRVYVTANLDGLSDGVTVGIGWYVNTLKPEDFVFVGESSVTVEGGGRQWIAVPYDLNGALEPRDYAVYLYVDGEVIGSLGIEILPAGSQPRSV
ncbi:MAG TPA: hypothetical protein VGT61_09460 [Thermomicrobiales bacterium]|nr:hypothetical protein [Thermomicrobiales bacterium]